MSVKELPILFCNLPSDRTCSTTMASMILNTTSSIQVCRVERVSKDRILNWVVELILCKCCISSSNCDEVKTNVPKRWDWSIDGPLVWTFETTFKGSVLLGGTLRCSTTFLVISQSSRTTSREYFSFSDPSPFVKLCFALAKLSCDESSSDARIVVPPSEPSVLSECLRFRDGTGETGEGTKTRSLFWNDFEIIMFSGSNSC